jgi:VCBS repeat-containing protein
MYGQGFDPSKVENCISWFDGADPDGSGAPTAGDLATWVNKIPSAGDAFQGNASWMPTVVLNALNGKSVVTFSQSEGDYMGIPVLANVRTVAMVLKENSGSGTHPFLGNSSDLSLFTRGIDGRIWGAAGSPIINGLTYLDTHPVRGESRVFSTDKYHILIFTTTESISIDSICDINTFWDGGIAEIVMYSRILTTGEINELNTYFSEKWALCDKSIPFTRDDFFSVPQDTECTIPCPGVLGNDSGFNPLKTTITLDTKPVHGTVTFLDNGSFTYTPQMGFVGADPFYYSITSDGIAGYKNKVYFNVVASGTNTAPLVVDDVYRLKSNSSLVLDAPGVLLNDKDYDGDSLGVTVSSPPVFVKNFNLGTDGSLTLEPEDNFSGDISFQYTVSDGMDTNVGVVTVHVEDADIPPVVLDDEFDIPNNRKILIPAPGVLNNDYDVDSQILMTSLESATTNGSIRMNGDGSFEYEANPSFTGTDTFTYKASDGQIERIGRVILNVKDSSSTFKSVGNLDYYSFTSSGGNSHISEDDGVLANDYNFGGLALSVSLKSDVSHGTLTLNSNGSFDYVPEMNYEGLDFFSYNLSGADEPISVTILVKQSSIDVKAFDDVYNVLPDTVFNLPSSFSILRNDYSIIPSEHDLLKAEIVQEPFHGLVTLNQDGSFTYVPTAGYSGIDYFKYKAVNYHAESATATVFLNIENHVVNAAVAKEDEFFLRKNYPTEVLAPGVLQNDFDNDNRILTAELSEYPVYGKIDFHSDGSFIYYPLPDFDGDVIFKYRVKDFGLHTSEAEVVLHIGENPDVNSPMLNNDLYFVRSGEKLVVKPKGFLDNDRSINGVSFTEVSFNFPQHGAAEILTDGSFTYTPEKGFTGVDFFPYSVSTSDSKNSSAVVQIVVLKENTPPVAVPDYYILNKGSSLTINSPGVLGNDFDLDSGTTIASELITSVKHGTLSLSADGAFSYTPEASFTGFDSFKYKIYDNVNAVGEGTVTLKVIDLASSPNHPPVAELDNFILEKNKSILITSTELLINDKDQDNDVLNVIIDSMPSHGTLNFGINNSYKYVPDKDFTGYDHFSYKVSDSLDESSSVMVSLTVKDFSPDELTPVDDIFYCGYDFMMLGSMDVAYPGVLSNDFYTGNVKVKLVTDIDHGTLKLNDDGSFLFNSDMGGSDASFQYSLVAEDGTESSPVTVKIIVKDEMYIKPYALPDSYTVKSDTLTFIPPYGILENDSVGTSVISEKSEHGTVVLLKDGSFYYTPDTGFTGTDSFKYMNCTDKYCSIPATVTLNVSAEGNHAPVANDDVYYTDIDTRLEVEVPGLFGNDSDSDGDHIILESHSSVSDGSLSIRDDGSFVYTPSSGFTGKASFTYKVTDGQSAGNEAEVAIWVGMNEAPVAVDDTYSTNMDTVLDVSSADGLLKNDTDKEGGALSINSVNNPSDGSLTVKNDGSFSYTPKTGFTGDVTFTYTITDGDKISQTATVTITVNSSGGGNNAPVATDDSYSVNSGSNLDIAAPGVLTNDTDADGDSLTAKLGTDVSHGTLTLNADGSFTYTPASGYTGSDSFTYSANDGTDDSSDATVTITVNPVGTNNPPIALPDEYSVNMNNTLDLAAPGVLDNDTDPDSDALTVKLITDVSHGTLTLNTDGSLSYKPEDNYFGSDSFEYSVNDGAVDSNTVTVKITVADTRVKVTLGTPVSVNISDVQGIAPNVQFSEKPAKIYGELNGKKLTLKKDKSSTVTVAKGIWMKKVALFDKKAIKSSGYAAVINGKSQEKIVQLKVKWKFDGEKIDNPANKVVIVPPLITSFSRTNNTIIIQGDYLGVKVPKVYLEPVAGGKLIKCKVDKNSFNYDPVSGHGSFSAVFKTKKVEPGTYNLIINNKVGIGIESNGNIPQLNL